MKRCPKCDKIYRDFDHYCMRCNYKLIYIEGTDKIEYVPNQFETPSELPTITCPYCQSTNTKKISGGSRWLSTGLFGLASKKIGKNFHCNKCSADF